MKTIVIANPRAAAGKVNREWSRYEKAIFDRFGQATVQKTELMGDATRLVNQAIDSGVERIIIVGGDGTLSEGVNGYYCQRQKSFRSLGPELVYLPAGTGGDFARTLGIRGLAPRKLLREGEARPVDVGQIKLTDAHGAPKLHYFINIASIGCSALIVNYVNRSSKRLGGQLSFLLGTLKGLIVWQNRRVHVRVDDTFDEELELNTIAIANGRSFGGGMKVAPNALLDDGEFDVVLVGSVNPLQFIAHAPKIYAGKPFETLKIRRTRGKTILIEPIDGDLSPVGIETDGETPGYLPMECTVLPRTLRLFSPWPLSKAVSQNT